jgi:hypothetical protein
MRRCSAPISRCIPMLDGFEGRQFPAADQVIAPAI